MAVQDDDLVHHIAEADLGAKLDELFAAGHSEVVIRHPSEGEIIVTRERYEKLLLELEAKRKSLTEQQGAFCTAMTTASVHRVDFEDGDFGTDIEGKALDIDETFFVPVAHYPQEIEQMPGEIGCFADPTHERLPLRIVDASVKVGH